MLRHLHSTFMWARRAWGAGGSCQSDLGHLVLHLPCLRAPQQALLPHRPPMGLEGRMSPREGKERKAH